MTYVFADLDVTRYLDDDAFAAAGIIFDCSRLEHKGKLLVIVRKGSDTVDAYRLCQDGKYYRYGVDKPVTDIARCQMQEWFNDDSNAWRVSSLADHGYDVQRAIVAP